MYFLQLSTGADANDVDGLGMSPLQIICMTKPCAAQTRCISLLLLHGADVNRVDSFGNTGCHNVILWGIGCNLLSQARQQDYSLPSMSPSELDALRAAQLASLEAMASHPSIDVTIANNDGDQPLHVATKLGLVTCMQVLLRATNVSHSTAHAGGGGKSHNKHVKRSHSDHLVEQEESPSRSHVTNRSRSHRSVPMRLTSPQAQGHSRDNDSTQEVPEGSSRVSRGDTRPPASTSSNALTHSLSGVPSIAQAVNYYSTSEDERGQSHMRSRPKYQKNSPRNHPPHNIEHASSMRSSRSAQSSSTGNRSIAGLTIDTSLPAVDNARHYYDISDDTASGDDTQLPSYPRSQVHPAEGVQSPSGGPSKTIMASVKSGGALGHSGLNDVDQQEPLSPGSEEMQGDDNVFKQAEEGADERDDNGEDEDYVVEEYAHLGVMRDGWVEYCTEDGDKYYYNSNTDRVQWKHPFQAELDRRAAIIARLPVKQRATDALSPTEAEEALKGDGGFVVEQRGNEREDMLTDVAEQTNTISPALSSPAKSGDETIKNKLREKYRQYTSSFAESSTATRQSSKTPHHGMSTSNIETSMPTSTTTRGNSTSHNIQTRTGPDIAHVTASSSHTSGKSMRTVSVTVGGEDPPKSAEVRKAVGNTASMHTQQSTASRTIPASVDVDYEEGIAQTRQRFSEDRATSPLPNAPPSADQFSTPSKKSYARPAVRPHLPRNPSISSLSGESEASRERHLEIWSRFFENAMIASHSREEAEDIRRKATRKGVSVGGFTPVFVRKKNGRKDAWHLPPATADYDATVARAMAMKEKEEAEAVMGRYASTEQAQRTAADGNWAILAAAMRGDVNTAEDLLLRGFNPSCVDDHIRSPLHYACRAGDTAMVALLNDYGSDIDATDINGQTPLHVACEFGRSEVVQCLLQCAASVDECDNFGNTPLHIVGSSGSVECCQILLEYGAAVDATNTAGRTPLDVALNRLTSHHGSTPALGVRKIIAMLSTASPTFNETSIGAKKGRDALVNSTVDEEYSLPSESVGDEGYIYGSEDSSSAGQGRVSRPITLMGQRGRSDQSRKSRGDGDSATSQDSESRIKDLKRRARRNRAESSASEGRGLRPPRHHTPDNGQQSVSSSGSHRRRVNGSERRSNKSSELKYADMKKEEWIERGRGIGEQGRGHNEPRGDTHQHSQWSARDGESLQSPPTVPSYSPMVSPPPLTLSVSDSIENRGSGDLSSNDSDDSADSTSPPSSVSVVRNVMWGAASLFGATLKMFSSSSTDATSAEATPPPSLHVSMCYCICVIDYVSSVLECLHYVSCDVHYTKRMGVNHEEWEQQVTIPSPLLIIFTLSHNRPLRQTQNYLDTAWAFTSTPTRCPDPPVPPQSSWTTYVRTNKPTAPA